MNLRSFQRMALWARNPPSLRRVILVFSVILVCLLVAGAERLGWWPDALTQSKHAPAKLPRPAP